MRSRAEGTYVSTVETIDKTEQPRDLGYIHSR